MDETLQDFGFKEIITPFSVLKKEERRVRLLQRFPIKGLTDSSQIVTDVQRCSVADERQLQLGDFVFFGSRHGGQRNAGFFFVTKEWLDCYKEPIYASEQMYIIRGSFKAKGLAYLVFALNNYRLTTQKFVVKLKMKLKETSPNDATTFTSDCEMLALQLLYRQQNADDVLNLIGRLKKKGNLESCVTLN